MSITPISEWKKSRFPMLFWRDIEVYGDDRLYLNCGRYSYEYEFRAPRSLRPLIILAIIVAGALIAAIHLGAKTPINF